MLRSGACNKPLGVCTPQFGGTIEVGEIEGSPESFGFRRAKLLPVGLSRPATGRRDRNDRKVQQCQGKFNQ